MPQVIQTNVPSLNSQRNLDRSQGLQSQALQRLSSGLRINSAKDDAAGLAISDRMNSQIRGLDQAKRNANDGISLMQTAEGALDTSGDMLQRMRELAVQSSNASNTPSDRAALQAEVNQLGQELDRLAKTTQFNGMSLLDGTFGTQNFQVGANAGQTVQVTAANFRTNVYGNNQWGADATASSSGRAAAAATWGANGVAGGALTVAGAAGSSTMTVAAGATAMATAAQINAASASTGVTATARTDIELKFSAAGGYTLNLGSDNGNANGVGGAVVNFSLTGTTGQTVLSDAATKINDASAKTGVTAKVNQAGDGLILTNQSGNDIQVATGAAVTNAGTVAVQKLDGNGVTSGAAQNVAVTAGSVISQGAVTLDSATTFSINDASGAINSAAGTKASALHAVSGIDISTFSGSQDAIKTIDSALSKISGQRAAFGAMQSRFEATTANLATSSENLSASRSRIRDTDFAAETAKLSKAQVLQQAGTAMLAQANALPQQVLSLLR